MCANPHLRRFVEANDLPTLASAFRNQDVVDNDHPDSACEVGINRSQTRS